MRVCFSKKKSAIANKLGLKLKKNRNTKNKAIMREYLFEIEKSEKTLPATGKNPPVVFFRPRTRYDCVTTCTVLEKFSTNEVWPEKTSVRCFHCHHSFDNTPVGIPIGCDVDVVGGVTKTTRYKCSGNYCSFECAKAGLVKSKDLLDASLLMLMRRDVYGVPMRKKDGTINHINRAPPKELLKCYGGKKTIEAFREYTQDNDTVVETKMLVASNPIVYSGRRMCGKKKRIEAVDSSSTGAKRTRALRAQRVANIINDTAITRDGDLSAFF